MRPKDIGTAAETKVVRYLLSNGWPLAERRALRGGYDWGDVTGTPLIVWEVKGGEAARTASDGQIAAWLAETEVERANASAELGVLVVARNLKNVRDWWACLPVGQLARLALRPGADLPLHQLEPVIGARITLEQVVVLLRAAGLTAGPGPELAA